MASDSWSDDVPTAGGPGGSRRKAKRYKSSSGEEAAHPVVAAEPARPRALAPKAKELKPKSERPPVETTPVAPHAPMMRLAAEKEPSSVDVSGSCRADDDSSSDDEVDDTTPGPLPKLDHYGFVVDGDGPGSPSDAPRPKVDNKRAKKWLLMMRAWDTWMKKKEKKVKSRARKGIPEDVRGMAWVHLSGAYEWKKLHPNHYAEYLKGDSRCEEDITKDLNRTFPKNILFMSKNGLGQRALWNVLRAYSVFDPSVGYCQGMAFIAGLLLMYMDEESAFAVLVRLLATKDDKRNGVSHPDFYPRFGLADLFRPGLPMLNKFCWVHQQLVDKHLPVFAAHMREEGVEALLYAGGWFMTLYTNSMPCAHLVRVWDCYLTEGKKVIYRVALAVLQHMQAQLMSEPFETLVHSLKAGVESPPMSPSALAKAVLKIDIKTAEIDKLEARYDKDHPPRA